MKIGMASIEFEASVRKPKRTASGSCNSCIGLYRFRRIRICNAMSAICNAIVAVPTVSGVSMLSV